MRDGVRQCSQTGRSLSPKALREQASHFAVIPDHVDEQIEHVVELRPGYAIVSKDGAAAEIAQDTDPRHT